MIPAEAVEAAHAAICEQNLDDCLEWRGRCVKAVEAAAPHMVVKSSDRRPSVATDAANRVAYFLNWHQGDNDIAADFPSGPSLYASDLQVILNELKTGGASERDELAQAWADGIEAGRIKAVMMRREICVPVLPDYVQNHLDDGWTFMDGEKA